MKSPWAIALLHHPVVDRRGKLVTTAVTNLDIHDLARIARTYGAARFYLVTPLAEQQRLVGRLLDHWRVGFGASHNPDRRQALELVTVTTDLAAALADFSGIAGGEPLVVLTGAGRRDGISFQDGRQLAAQQSLLVTFGTGSGLAPQVFDQGWPVLESIAGASDYNHLPVRAAAAIICDRLFGPA